MKTFVLLTGIVFFNFVMPGTSVFAEDDDQNGEGEQELNLVPDAKSAILMERDTGKVLYKKNTDEELAPASMTKIMTLLLIMEALDNGEIEKDETIRVSERAASMGGSQIFLEKGEEMSVDDLLKGIAIASANDASVALAERIAGSEKAFVKKMNQKADTLGLNNTQFQNSTGLPADNHYSTARDMALISKELLTYESVTNYTSIYEDYLRKGEENEFWLVNTNRLVKFYPGVDGLKTGYTNEAKYCLTATAEKNDMRMIAVVMGAETTKKRNAAISKMLDYSFNHYETENLYDKGDTVTTIDFLKSEQQTVDVAVSQSVSTIHEKGEADKHVTTSTEMDADLTLPLQKGDQVGRLVVKNDGKTLSTTPLTITDDVDKASYITLLKRTVQNMVR
ncbi:D-alanyl-D-alanine carboxypeptidase DacF [Lentibacillus halophilus]|uniref:serine-type D-Ala-D-Ala carboxypeptidase n=1 Tax=Lentibacillus halophilus TaxID=295065 RepID=A0ABN0ZDM2_9BACI